MTFSTSFLKVIMQDIAIPHEICLQLLGVKVTHLMYSSRIKKYTKSLQMTSTNICLSGIYFKQINQDEIF